MLDCDYCHIFRVNKHQRFKPLDSLSDLDHTQSNSKEREIFHHYLSDIAILKAIQTQNNQSNKNIYVHPITPFTSKLNIFLLLWDIFINR